MTVRPEKVVEYDAAARGTHHAAGLPAGPSPMQCPPVLQPPGALQLSVALTSLVAHGFGSQFRPR